MTKDKGAEGYDASNGERPEYVEQPDGLKKPRPKRKVKPRKKRVKADV